MKLYGLGRRGVAIHMPDSDPDMPLPLFTDPAPVQAVIDEQNRKRGLGVLHVIEYEVRDV